MNTADQMLLARTKLLQRIEERQVQIKAKLDSVNYCTNEFIHGGLDKIKEHEAQILFTDFMQLMAD
ncbi:MAG: hypothetical protein V1806_04985, partial [Pseudomonadota bacterium]